MAESLSTERLEERRTNLRAFRAQLEMEDDSELNTTLLMQEEWLATIDELQGYMRDAQRIRGLRLLKCRFVVRQGVICSGYWADTEDYCAPCYLRAIHKPVTEITELELHSISLDSDKPHGPKPPFPGPATGMRTPEAIAKEFHDMTEALVEEPEENQELVDEFLREVRREDAKTAREEDCVCKGGFVDYLGPPCPVHPIPDKGEPVSEHRIRSMPPCDDRPECETSGQDHTWALTGKMTKAIMEWEDSVKCLRCNKPFDGDIPVPMIDFDVQEEVMLEEEEEGECPRCNTDSPGTWCPE